MDDGGEIGLTGKTEGGDRRKGDEIEEDDYRTGTEILYKC